MNIYKIRTCRFTSIDPYGSICRLNYEISEDQICVMNLETSVATDIFTQEQFYVLKRDKSHRIAKEEFDKITLKQKYGVEVNPYDIGDLGLIDYYKTSLAYLKTVYKKSKDGHQKIKR